MRNSLYFLTFALLSLFPGGLRASSAPENTGIFQAANVDYLGGRYEDAIRKYESLVSGQTFSPAIFFNLANTYAKDGEIGKAIVNYERARYLSPRDPDILANLKFITQQEQIARPDARWFLQYTVYLSPNQWFILSFIMLVLAAGNGIARALKLNIPVALRKNMMLIVLLLGSIGCLGSGFYVLRKFQYAIVTKPETSMTLSPIPGSPLVTVLTDGLFVKPIKSHGDYILVQTFNNQKGWVPQSSVENILIR